jgi:hypothetical protein
MNRSPNGVTNMKTKMLIATLLGCLVWQQAALSQTDTAGSQAAGNGMFTPVPPPSAAPVDPPASVADTNGATAAAATNPPAVMDTSAATNSTEATTDMTATNATESATTVSSNEPAATGTTAAPEAMAATNTESAELSASNATATATEPAPAAPQTIPLIQFQDVPLTTAIENLARQAGINYLLDPKIG